MTCLNGGFSEINTKLLQQSATFSREQGL